MPGYMLHPIVYSGVAIVMFCGIAFFAGALLVLLFVPLVHDRAVRVTTRRFEATIPTSLAEMRAIKDGLRAKFALEVRRLETIADELRARMAAHLVEIGKKSNVINELKNDATAKAAEISALVAQEGSWRDQLRAAARVADESAMLLYQAERELAHSKGDVTELRAALGAMREQAEKGEQTIQWLRKELERAYEAEFDRAEGIAAAHGRDPSFERKLARKTASFATRLSAARLSAARLSDGAPAH